MPILRAQKEELVNRLTSELQNSRVALVFAYTALNMKANDTLRTKSFEAGAKIKMISNNLLRLILKNINRELEIPEKTLALAYGFDDEIVAAKTLVEFAKETETLEVIGGWIDGSFFDASQVKTLALLPSKETMQAQLVGRLSGLIGSLAYSLNYPIQKFAFVVEAVKSASGESVESVQPSVAETPKAEEVVDPSTKIPADEQPTEESSEKPDESTEKVKESEEKTESKENNEGEEKK